MFLLKTQMLWGNQGVVDFWQGMDDRAWSYFKHQ